MRSKQDVEKEFNQVKAQLEQAQQVVLNCQKRMSELTGQFQLLEEMEKEKAEAEQLTKTVAEKIKHKE